MTRSRSSARRALPVALRRAVIGGALLFAALVVTGCDTEADEVEAVDGSFYLEARVVVSPAGPDLTRGELLPTVTELQWWFLDARRQRQELARIDPFFEAESYAVTADGKHRTVYDPGTGTYQQMPLPEEESPWAPHVAISALLGPVPYGDVQTFLDEWKVNDELLEPDGTDEILGRTVEVFKYGPIWSESTGDSTGQRIERSGGVGRVYLDLATAMVLRHEMGGNEGRGQDVVAEVTHLDLEPSFDSAAFSPRLPDGAIEHTDSSSSSCGMSGSGGAGMWSFSSGYLRPSYDPEGWQPAGSGASSGDDCAVIEEWGALEHREGGQILLMQRPVPAGGVPPLREGLTPVDLGGVEGYRTTSPGVDGDVEQLLWVQDGIIARLQTDTAPFEELVRIAESVEVVR